MRQHDMIVCCKPQLAKPVQNVIERSSWYKNVETNTGYNYCIVTRGSDKNALRAPEVKVDNII